MAIRSSNSRILDNIHSTLRFLGRFFVQILIFIKLIFSPAFKSITRWEKSAISSLNKNDKNVSNALSFKILILSTVSFLAVYIIFVGAMVKSVYNNPYHPTKLDNFAELIFPYPAEFTNRNVISLKRIQWEVKARSFYNQKHSITSTDDEIAKFTINQISDRILYIKALSDNGIKIDSNEASTEYKDIVNKTGNEINLLAFLKDNYGPDFTLDRFKIWINDSISEATVKNQLLEKVAVKHILISVPESAPQANIDAALKKAQEAKSKITKPEDFDAVAKDYSDDLASRDKGGLIGTTIRGAGEPAYFNSDFEKAVFNLPVNQVSEPIRSSIGWHIVIVTAKEGFVPKSLTDYTLDLRAKARLKSLLK